MLIRDQICEMLEGEKDGLTAEEVSAKLRRPNRTYVGRLLKELVKADRVQVRRTGEEARYKLVEEGVLFSGEILLGEMEEEEIWQEVRQTRELFERAEKAETVMYFAFTEMMNNAIEHSGAEKGFAKIWVEEGKLKFTVRDFGRGIFGDVAAARGLLERPFERFAGASERGVIWVGELADKFEAKSAGARLFREDGKWTATAGEKGFLGTEVNFEIALDTEKVP